MPAFVRRRSGACRGKGSGCERQTETRPSCARLRVRRAQTAEGELAVANGRSARRALELARGRAMSVLGGPSHQRPADYASCSGQYAQSGQGLTGRALHTG
jgi:hypothetical protein